MSSTQPRISLEMLGEFIRINRESKGISQEDLIGKVAPSQTRHVISKLEQGERLPEAATLEKIAKELAIPDVYWKQFTTSKAKLRGEFEQALNELIGYDATRSLHEESAVSVVEDQLESLFANSPTAAQSYDEFRRVLVFYGVREISRAFFERYLGRDAFQSVEVFETAIRRFQKDAIRLYSTFAEAFEKMNGTQSLDSLLLPLQPRNDEHYILRKKIDLAEDVIPESQLKDLGYISVATITQEIRERTVLSAFLTSLAIDMRTNPVALDLISEAKRRRMDSLLRKFNSSLEHGLYSQLFKVDPDKLERESKRLSPNLETDLKRIGITQSQGLRNLCNYLTADYVDVYVATSMRADSDFVSVHRFAKTLFQHPDVEPYHLRYFDPTQSWIEDRVAKGLVEALMLRRANFTIYMAQKGDTFGKDSEASVALGLGRPVIVYVPKLVIPEHNIDTQELSEKDRGILEGCIRNEAKEEGESDIDATIDDEGLITRLLTIRLRQLKDSELITAVVSHWADFDLAGEDERFETDEDKKAYRKWLDEIAQKGGEASAPPAAIRKTVIKTLIATAARFERRARLFREIHPLALQVILSTGVLNGIVVVRSVEECAKILKAFIRNELELELHVDENNYRLVEKTTGSTIRVISRHRLIQNACKSFFANAIALRD